MISIASAMKQEEIITLLEAYQGKMKHLLLKKRMVLSYFLKLKETLKLLHKLQNS